MDGRLNRPRCASKKATAMSFTSFNLHPDLLRGVEQLGFAVPTPIQKDAIPAGDGGPGRPRLRHDGQRQDRGVPAPDPAAPASASPAASRARSSSRRRASSRRRSTSTAAISPFTRRLRRRGVRRRRHGAAGARVPQRRRRHRRDARPAARSLPVPVRAPATGSRSSSSTRRTGCSTWASSPTSAACCKHLPAQAPDAVLLGHAAAADRGAVPRDAARPGDDQRGAAAGAGRPASRTRSTPCATELKSALLLGAAGRARACGACSSSRARSTAPTGWPISSRATASRSTASTATAARPSAPQALAGFKDGKVRVLVATDIAARGHRRRRAEPRGELRRAGGPRGLHPPRRAARRAPRPRATRSPSCLAGRRGGSPRDRAGDRPAHRARDAARLRLHASARPSGSKCRWPSGSPPSARRRPRSAAPRAPTPNGGPTTAPAPERARPGTAAPRNPIAARPSPTAAPRKVIEGGLDGPLRAPQKLVAPAKPALERRLLRYAPRSSWSPTRSRALAGASPLAVAAEGRPVPIAVPAALCKDRFRAGPAP